MTNVAEAAAAYEKAKAVLTEARKQLAEAQVHEKTCTENERAAYKAFNEAVDAMRPKRGPRPKKDGAGEQ